MRPRPQPEPRAASRRGARVAETTVMREAGAGARASGGEAPARGAARFAWGAALLAIGALALAWRWAFLARWAASPLADSRIADERAYWDWATYVLAHGARGHHPFFLAPLYPYVLALVRLATGDAMLPVLRVQALWGAAAAVLLADAARRLTRPAIGVAIGLAVAFGAMAVAFDALVLTESLLFFLGALLLWSVARAGGRAPGVADAAAWGALVGLLAEGRATHLVLLVPAAVRLASAGSRVRAWLVMLTACACVTLPGAVRNRAVSGEWIPFTYNLGYNLAVGNHANASGSFATITGTEDLADPSLAGEDGGVEGDGRLFALHRTGRAMTPAESSRWWAERARAWIVAHPLEAARLWARKLVMLWSRHEYPQIENADEMRALAGPLGVPWLGAFAILAALAFAGLASSWRAPAGRFLALALALETAALLPFFVTDRYRHALMPFALLAAALGIDAASRAWRERRVQPAVLLAAALGVALALAPVPHLSRERYAWGLAVDVGERWLHHGGADLAEASFARAAALDAAGAVDWRADTNDSLRRGGGELGRGRALRRLGRLAEAREAFARAAAFAPGSATIREEWASALAATGDVAGATRQYAALGRERPGAEAEMARALACVDAGDPRSAIPAFAAAIAADSSRGEAWGGLVRAQVLAGRGAAALATIEHARAMGWSGDAIDAHEAMALAACGRRDDARRLHDAVPANAWRRSDVLRDVAHVTDSLLARAR